MTTDYMTIKTMIIKKCKYSLAELKAKTNSRTAD